MASLELNDRYNLGVIIGRFQPVHNDHINQIIVPALEQCDKVLVILGSCHTPRTIKNPFTASQRQTMIMDALYKRMSPIGNRIDFRHARDFPYDNNRWRAQMLGFAHEFEKDDSKIALFGAEKDASSFYLKFFPLWKLVAPQGGVTGMGSTAIREAMFTGDVEGMLAAGLPEVNTDFITCNWIWSVEGERLQAEYKHITNYKKQFKSYPYPPIFHTVDNVVLYNGHILMVQRGAMPGKGLWALPGGFLNVDEWSFQGAMRELMEETGLKAKPEWYNPNGVLFDYPGRSLRGRTITTAYLCVVPSRFPAPTVKGMDDADKARWFSLDQVLGENPPMVSQVFEDHLDIIREMVERA